MRCFESYILQTKSKKTEASTFMGGSSSSRLQKVTKADDHSAKKPVSRKHMEIDVIYPQEGGSLCYPHELELIADLRREDQLIGLDEDLSAVILLDGVQISHLFSGSLDCRLPPHVQNRSAELEVAVMAGDGSTLVKKTVSTKYPPLSQ